jgi:hypothetical protein
MLKIIFCHSFLKFLKMPTKRQPKIVSNFPPIFWQPKDVRNWLSSINLELYGPRFEWNQIDGSSLLQLTTRDFNLLGVSVQDQLHIKNQIQLLQSNFPL